MHCHERLLGCDIISAGIFLKHQLHLQQRDLSLEISVDLTNCKAVRNIRAFATARGVVIRRKIPAETAKDMTDWLRNASSLRHLPQTTFYTKDSLVLGADTEIERYPDNQARIVSHLDLCPFVYQSNIDAQSGEQPLFIGLASCRVEDGDEVWQFHDTPLTFIMRPIRNEDTNAEITINGYVMVGRAFLVRPEGRNFDEFKRSQEYDRKPNELGFCVREIQLDILLLLNLVFWADMESESSEHCRREK